MLVKIAKQITGGLSAPSKMPGKSYSIPAKHCKTGSKLRLKEGTVCSKCYACKGNYTRFKNVVDSLEYRFQSLTHPDWVEAMVTLIGDETYFRWHDSGDIQGLRHLARICSVVEQTPDTMHWLPTKELKMVRDYLAKHGGVPENLVIRLSAPTIDSPILKGTKYENVLTCRSVTFSGTPDTGKSHTCPAPLQGGTCGDCRACWNTNVEDVAYLMH